MKFDLSQFSWSIKQAPSDAERVRMCLHEALGLSVFEPPVVLYHAALKRCGHNLISAGSTSQEFSVDEIISLAKFPAASRVYIWGDQFVMADPLLVGTALWRGWLENLPRLDVFVIDLTFRWVLIMSHEGWIAGFEL